MRLHASAVGAVAYLLAARAAARIPSATMEARQYRRVQFQDFSRYLGGSESTKIYWDFQGDDSISITNVFLHRIDVDGRIISVVAQGLPTCNYTGPRTPDEPPGDSWNPGNQCLEATSEQGSGSTSVETRDPDSENLTFIYNAQGKNGYATLRGSQRLNDTALCLSVGWFDNLSMRAYSHAFAITGQTNRSGQTFKTLNATFEKASNVAGKYQGEDVQPSILWALASSSEAAVAPTNSASAGADQGSSGLSVGAKAGIGVGAGIGGLLLVGGLVYFFFFWRRRRRGPRPYGRGAGVDFASDSGVMVRDKELAGVSQSGPHSLYAPDPGRRPEHDSPAHSPVVGGGGADSGPAATPALPSSEPGLGGGATPASASSRPTSEVRSPSRYAHLIEEGMTQDEIQRLEEEERQLDAAIENAGRQSRSA